MIKELSPQIVRKIWGGLKLEKMKSLAQESKASLDPIGETLEIYDLSLPYLAKFIDTSDELSIQVHPGDDYARLHENSAGKTECWIILEAHPGAGVYLGLKAHVTKDLLKKALNEQKNISDYLHFYPVKKGDFFYVTAGSIHAIGKNVTLAEVQQNSGITYRLWDWNRVDDLGVGRELHIDKSLDVINFEPHLNTPSFFRLRHDLFQTEGLSELCVHPDFQLFFLNLKKGENFERDLSRQTRACSILNLEGTIKINQVNINSYSAVTLENEKQLSVHALEKGALLLIL